MQHGLLCRCCWLHRTLGPDGVQSSLRHAHEVPFPTSLRASCLRRSRSRFVVLTELLGIRLFDSVDEVAAYYGVYKLEVSSAQMPAVPVRADSEAGKQLLNSARI